MRDEDFCAGRLDIGMLDRKLQSGELGGETEVDSESASSELNDLPIIAAAIARELETSKLGSETGSVPAGARSNWGAFGRRELLRLRGP